MHPIVFITAIAIAYTLLYLVIKTAVFDAILQARAYERERDNGESRPGGEDTGEQISQVTCPACGVAHDMDYAVCPHCKHRYA